MTYLITHPERNFGSFNPEITVSGTRRIVYVRDMLMPKIPVPPLVVVGTGLRFLRTYELLFPQGHPSVHFSPFCGSGDALEQDGSISMVVASIPSPGYIGLGHPAFNAKNFLNSFPKNTLLCCGGELMQALGFKSEKGHLYELDFGTANNSEVHYREIV